MRTHEDVVAELLKRSGTKEEVDRIYRDEADLLDLLLKARGEAGLTRPQLAERMGVLPQALSRFERSLATGNTFPSLEMILGCVEACGK